MHDAHSELTPVMPLFSDAHDPGSKAHWERVYQSRSPTELSWYQPQPTRSLELLEQLGMTPSTEIIDVGGGTSTLIDALLDRGVARVAVLDISRAALEHTKARLGARAASVSWIEADVARADFGGPALYDIWHDRAVFHFLTNRDDRRRYVSTAANAIKPGGAALVATFALQGPSRCSGLDVVRYDAELLACEFDREFSVERSIDDFHRTPSGIVQAFTYTVLRRTRGG